MKWSNGTRPDPTNAVHPVADDLLDGQVQFWRVLPSMAHGCQRISGGWTGRSRPEWPALQTGAHLAHRLGARGTQATRARLQKTDEPTIICKRWAVIGRWRMHGSYISIFKVASRTVDLSVAPPTGPRRGVGAGLLVLRILGISTAWHFPGCLLCLAASDGRKARII